MISILVAAALSSQPSLPSLKRGEPYARARTNLKRHGWRPVITNADLGDGTPAKKFGDAAIMLRAGFKEVYDCSGTGRNYCTFVWKSARGCIHVTTYGEYFPKHGAPKVYYVKRGSCTGAE